MCDIQVISERIHYEGEFAKISTSLMKEQLDFFSSTSKDASSPKITSLQRMPTSLHTQVSFFSNFTQYVVFYHIQAMSYGMILIFLGYLQDNSPLHGLNRGLRWTLLPENNQDLPLPLNLP